MLDLAFLNPWILTALFGLPVIYLLLKVIPPAPRIISIPTFRFIQNLSSKNTITSTTPWWLLLLRLLIAALIILALAAPIYKPAPQITGSGTLRIIIDNSWASASNWKTITNAALNTITSTDKNRNFIIIPTTASPNENVPKASPPLTSQQALSMVKALKPQPWPAQYKHLTKTLKDEDIQTIWFSHGIIESGLGLFLEKVRKQGTLTSYTPETENLALALQRTENSSQTITLQILADKDSKRRVTLQTLSENGTPLDQQTIKLEGSVTPVSFTPQSGTNVAQIRILNENSAAAIHAIDENNKRRHIGIVSPTESAESQPFIEASYYLKRALGPYASLTFGSTSEILNTEPSLIILPDIGTLPPETLGQLERWVKDGGILLRYSGPNTVKHAKNLFLSPVKLRAGGRAMDGAITWEKPARLTQFSENSPLFGIELHDPITVQRQILAVPAEDLDKKTWASLEDGTPLITAESLEDGLLVLIHTTATPAWSDFALSGAYIETLRRILALSGHKRKLTQQLTDGTLTPEWVFDGFGKKQQPPGTLKPVPLSELSNIDISAITPPGLYSKPGYQHILNLGDQISSIRSNHSLLNTSERQLYSEDFSVSLMAPLLLLACLLFAIDWIIIQFITSPNFLRFKRIKISAVVICLLATNPTQLWAQTEKHTDFSTNLYLAYMKTGNNAVDSTSHQGLTNLAKALGNRTSAEPKGVIGLNIEQDEIIFFPVIYWPISATQAPLSSKALEKIQHYLDHGGTILIDKKQRASARGNPEKDQALQGLIGSLNIPPMHPIPQKHVLSKSFYLLDHYPGLSSGDTIWVERKGTRSHDGVSSIIIGSHDWSGAWSTAENGTTPTRQYELALRFGINVVMYALTGNYKADQVHLPAILERLGE